MKNLVLVLFFSTTALFSTFAGAKSCDVNAQTNTDKRALESYKVLVHYVLRPSVQYDDNTTTGFDLSTGSNESDMILFTNALAKKKFLESEFPVVADYKETCL